MHALRKTLAAMLILIAGSGAALAQVTDALERQGIPPAKSAWAPAQQKAARVVTNGELSPERPFSLLVAYDGSSESARVVQMVKQPGQYMQSWSQGMDLQVMDVRDQRALIVLQEQHQDLLAKHEYQMPLVALVDRTGGVWWSAAGRQIPTDEQTFASTLGRYYAATLDAARAAGINPPVAPSNSPAVQRANTSNGNGGSYFLERNQTSPYSSPYVREGGRDNRILRGGLIDVPDKINTSVGLEGDTMRTVIGIGIVAIVCCLIAAAGRIFAAQISANAITDDPDDEGAK
jgi:hypothetical protein